MVKQVNKAYIRRVFIECFEWADGSDVERLYDMLEDDIISDIEETADHDFNDSDVRIAIMRVLQEKALPF